MKLVGLRRCNKNYFLSSQGKGGPVLNPANDIMGSF